MKKIFIISSVVLGFILLLLAVYNLAFRNNVNNPFVDSKKTIEVKSLDATDFAAAKNTAISVIADEKVMAPTYDSKENSVLYFVSQKREIKKVSVDTSSTMSLMTLSGEPLRAVWSPSQKQVLAEMRTYQETRWYMIDIEKKTETALKSGIEKPIWTSLGDRIVYKYYDAKTKERSLNIANPDGSDWKKIADSPFKNMSAAVTPQGSLLAFWNQGNAYEETSLRMVSLIGGDVKTVFSGKFGADYVFSPDGQKILLSSTNQKGGTSTMLGLLLNQGTQYQNLLIPTLAAKATWSKNSTSLYYALPGALPDNAVMPNDYFSKPLVTQDTFWKVNVETGEKKRIVETKDIDKGYDASFMSVSDDETALVFVNRTDGKLYRIKL